MTLPWLAITAVGVHAAFAFTQLAAMFFGSGIAFYGGDHGLFSQTPLGPLLGDGDSDQFEDKRNIIAMFDYAVRIGDFLWGMTTFEYDVVRIIREEYGLLEWLAALLRVGSWVLSLLIHWTFLTFVFSSGIMSSTAGQIMVLGGGTIYGVLQAFGAAF